MTKKLIGLFAFLILAVMATTDAANAVVYCTYVGYPARCVVRAGVVLRPRPVVVVAPVRRPVVVAPVRRRPVVVVR